MVIVVSDTSPIRALGHLGLMDLLRDLYSEVIVPPAVATELLNPASGLGAIDVRRFPFVRVQKPGLGYGGRVSRSLDAGEFEALTPALEVRAQLVLIDEAKDRAEARRLGLVPVGVLGTLLRAKQRGYGAAIDPLMDRLQRELRFFISDRVRLDVLRDAGEEPEDIS